MCMHNLYLHNGGNTYRTLFVQALPLSPSNSSSTVCRKVSAILQNEPGEIHLLVYLFMRDHGITTVGPVKNKTFSRNYTSPANAFPVHLGHVVEYKSIALSAFRFVIKLLTNSFMSSILSISFFIDITLQLTKMRSAKLSLSAFPTL